jgi:hypothetical protein
VSKKLHPSWQPINLGNVARELEAERQSMRDDEFFSMPDWNHWVHEKAHNTLWWRHPDYPWHETYQIDCAEWLQDEAKAFNTLQHYYGKHLIKDPEMLSYHRAGLVAAIMFLAGTGRGRIRIQ